MSWYAAHIIMYLKLKTQPQDRYLVWENVVLFEAASGEQAWEKAQQRGHEEEGDCDGSLRWGEQPATWVFAGIRQLVDSEAPDERPGDGTEVSYSEIEVDSLEAIEQLAEGRSATVRFLGIRDDDEQDEDSEHVQSE